MKLYINNFSVSCALGSTTKEVEQNLFKADPADLAQNYTLVDGGSTPVFKIPKILNSVPSEFKLFDSRNNALILNSLQEIDRDIRKLKEKFGAGRIGVILGTSTSGLEEGIKAFSKTDGSLNDSYHYPLQELGSPSDFVKTYYGLSSIAYTVSTACSSGARAVIEGYALLKNDICDAVIVGASDTINDITLNGFHSLEAISLKLTNPFSKNRSGINIGEGAGIFILSKIESDLEIKGMGDSTDAYHISSPDPTGLGAMKSMEQALAMAHLKPSDIDYINLHGTGTLKNDSMEAQAVSKVFSGEQPLVSSTKPLTGHTLGAAGAVELAICALSLKSNQIPPHFYDGEYDASIPRLNLSSGFRSQAIRNCMSNSYAFGGNNASIVVGKN